MWGKKPEITLEEAISYLNQANVLEILTEVGNKAVSRYKQDLKAEIDTNVDDALRKFRDIVTHRSWRTAQKWCKWGDDAPVLMPDHTRIYYRRGSTEVVVLEFAPQLRRMRFKTKLTLPTSTWEATDDGVHSYTLALPYINFIFQLRDGLFQDVWVAFSDRPLKTLKERPLRPYLSNLDSNLKLCLGRDFVKSDLERGNITQQVAYVLSHFWQSVYSDEWSSHFWNNKTHFTDIDDARLSNLEGWQAASIDNPLFVVEDVQWLPHSVEHFGEMVSVAFEEDQEDLKFQSEMYDDIAECFAEEVREALLDQVDATESSLKAGHVESLATKLLEHFRELNTKVVKTRQE